MCIISRKKSRILLNSYVQRENGSFKEGENDNDPSLLSERNITLTLESRSNLNTDFHFEVEFRGSTAY